MSGRAWCYTLNNYSVEDMMIVEAIDCRYQVCGYERGEQGTEHIQGYIEFGKVMRLAAVKKLVPKAHWEVRRGTREQARTYCQKEGSFIELGDWEKGGQGARNDLGTVMAAVKEGTKMRDLMEELPEVVARNMRFVEKYQALVERDSTRGWRDVETVVLHGPAETGKSRAAAAMAPDAFRVNPEDSFPLDGYDGEATLIIDDFDGEGIKYAQMLKMLDGYQYRVNVKGSHRYAAWTKVIITSNLTPARWYPQGLTPALARRLDTVTEFGNEVAGNTEPLPWYDNIDISASDVADILELCDI